MPGKAEKGKVLIVDDDDTILSFLKMALSYEGFPCVGATDGEEAMKVAREEKLGLILLDISMPKMDGKEFCQWLRSELHSEVPVIIMTAGQNAARTCEEIGAQACLNKPFDVSELQTIVQLWGAGV